VKVTGRAGQTGIDRAFHPCPLRALARSAVPRTPPRQLPRRRRACMDAAVLKLTAVAFVSMPPHPTESRGVQMDGAAPERVQRRGLGEVCGAWLSPCSTRVLTLFVVDSVSRSQRKKVHVHKTQPEELHRSVAHCDLCAKSTRREATLRAGPSQSFVCPVEQSSSASARDSPCRCSLQWMPNVAHALTLEMANTEDVHVIAWA